MLILLAYMPTLTPEQIIEAFVNTANKSDVNAMLKTNVNNRFDLISKSGGVIDVYKAAQYAYDKFYKSNVSKTKATPKTAIKKKKVVKKK